MEDTGATSSNRRESLAGDGLTANRGGGRRAPLAIITLLVVGAAATASLSLQWRSSGRQGAAGPESQSFRAESDAIAGELATIRKDAASPPLPWPVVISDGYRARQVIDTSGFGMMQVRLRSWGADATLEEIADIWRDAPEIEIAAIDEAIAAGVSKDREVRLKIHKSSCLGIEGQSSEASRVLAELRDDLKNDPELEKTWLYSVIFFQGVFALRQGEDENCILCRGESSCILPIAPSAVHVNQEGSRRAIGYFREYLERFPQDLQVKWLLNLAYMTLGEHPDNVPSEHLISLEKWRRSEFDIGVFRDVGHLVGLNRLNISGGAIMDDFDDDGLFDVVFTNWYPTKPMAFFRNSGDGRFEDLSASAGVANQLGGLYCVQADYNNDGLLDIFIARGAWVAEPMRPTLLRNDGPVGGEGSAGQGVRFTDVTAEAQLLQSVNSITAQWADYDNDGWIDLFVACERQPNLLYRNKGDGAFEEVAERLGVDGREFAGPDGLSLCKGAAWIDFDNDDYPDLFLNHLTQIGGKLLRNNGGQSFVDVSDTLGVSGPQNGFSCWTWDYDNDGWLDIFATCYAAPIEELLHGIAGDPPTMPSNRLYRNIEGTLFQDVAKQAGLDGFYLAMGSNFGDFDNDGWLDMYLGTGDPKFTSLVPNRMFKNVRGKRFAEITASSRTGNLQKGHGVGCGDWDRDGDVDIFIQMGGAVPGDSYHNILLQNPGQGNRSISVKLIGKKTNRAAIGTRIKAVAAGENPLVIHRHVSSGSSFGANPLEQHLGIGGAKGVATLEVHWPTSGATQIFHDIPAGQQIEITEFAEEYRVLNRSPIALPE